MLFWLCGVILCSWQVCSAMAILPDVKIVMESEGNTTNLSYKMNNTTTTAITSTVSTTDSSKYADSRRVRSFPLVPHQVQRERQRRSRRDLLWDDSALKDTIGDAPRRRDEAQQVGALYQGYGTHYVDLWCGSPPQRQTVIVDTGSGVTAFPCSGCNDCGVPKYHIDQLFVEADSSTFHANKCSSTSDCVSSRSRCRGDQCTISMSYAEGSRWNAYEGVDRCYVAGPHEIPLVSTQAGTAPATIIDDLNPKHAADLAFEMTFGCQTLVTGLFKTQLADGIMGMSNRPETFWRQMFQANKMGSDQAFSLCFSRQPTAARAGTESGALTLGGVDVRLHESPMVFTPRATQGRSSFFSVKIRRIMLRGGRAGESAKSKLVNPNEGVKVLDLSESDLNTGGVIVDSGTTDTYWNRGIASEFKKVFEQLSGGRQHVNKPLELTDEELASLPTILFQLQSDSEETNPDVTDIYHTTGMAGALDPKHPSDVILAFPPSHYMEYDPSTDTYTSRFYPTESSGSVLGANAMMGHDILFDVDNDRIGWAESSCDYTSLVQGNGYNFDITGELKDVEIVSEDKGATADCSSFSSGAKCQSAEGCSWYWGKCSKTSEDQSDNTPAPSASAPIGGEPRTPPPAGSDGSRPPPKDDDEDEGIVDAGRDFLQVCSTPACRYPVAFGLVIALFTGCCFSYCCFRLRGSEIISAGEHAERYKYERAPADANEIELTNGMNGNGTDHHQVEAFRDEPIEPPSNGIAQPNSAGDLNGSYRDGPKTKSQFSDEPEFEGDFA